MVTLAAGGGWVLEDERGTRGQLEACCAHKTLLLRVQLFKGTKQLLSVR